MWTCEFVNKIKALLIVPWLYVSNTEQHGLPRCSTLMMARGVAGLADCDASQNTVLQTSANQVLLVRGYIAEDLNQSSVREAYITKAG